VITSPSWEHLVLYFADVTGPTRALHLATLFTSVMLAWMKTLGLINVK
jgi:hypothetical protein